MTKRIKFIAGAVVGLFASLSTIAMAGSPDTPRDCDDTAKWHAYLADSYGEKFLRVIPVGNDAEAEVWVDPAEGDWTMLTIAGPDTRCAWGYGPSWPREWE